MASVATRIQVSNRWMDLYINMLSSQESADVWGVNLLIINLQGDHDSIRFDPLKALVLIWPTHLKFKHNVYVALLGYKISIIYAGNSQVISSLFQSTQAPWFALESEQNELNRSFEISSRSFRKSGFRPSCKCIDRFRSPNLEHWLLFSMILMQICLSFYEGAQEIIDLWLQFIDLWWCWNCVVDLKGDAWEPLSRFLNRVIW